jgi:hypothetical protein
MGLGSKAIVRPTYTMVDDGKHPFAKLLPMADKSFTDIRCIPSGQLLLKVSAIPLWEGGRTKLWRWLR